MTHDTEHWITPLDAPLYQVAEEVEVLPMAIRATRRYDYWTMDRVGYPYGCGDRQFISFHTFVPGTLRFTLDVLNAVCVP